MDIPFVPDTSPEITLNVSAQGAKLLARVFVADTSQVFDKITEGLTEHGKDVAQRLRTDIACQVYDVCEHGQCPFA